jgi:hypothetical protein
MLSRSADLHDHGMLIAGVLLAHCPDGEKR